MQKLTFHYLQGITTTMFTKLKKDIDTEPISYADMMILWQVNRIRNSSKHDKELVLNENSQSDFVMVPYPMYEQETPKILGITKDVGQVVVLGDPDDTLFDNEFGGDEKLLWSGYQRYKMNRQLHVTSFYEILD